jgi:luciferase family oxidoreductase group 1
MNPLPLSFLDLTRIQAGESSAQTVQHAVELARIAEALGYRRYWFAEHHNSRGLASGTPEVMIAHVANHTTTIRVGSGGIMLPNHPPLRIAETFRLLNAIFPDRVDLGMGRAPGTDQKTALALRRNPEALAADDYPELLAELLAYDDDAMPAGHPFAGIVPMPTDSRLPPIWLLGSSGFSGQLAAEVGLGYSFASHINRNAAVPAMNLYRDRFTPSARNPEPHAILAVSVLIGETEEHARELYRIAEVQMYRLLTNQQAPAPTLDEARNVQITELQRLQMSGMMSNMFVGDAANVANQVHDLASETRADEVMLTSVLADQADRIRAVEQFHQEWTGNAPVESSQPLSASSAAPTPAPSVTG